jgi:hypothetical protein
MNHPLIVTSGAQTNKIAVGPVPGSPATGDDPPTRRYDPGLVTEHYDVIVVVAAVSTITAG